MASGVRSAGAVRVARAPAEVFRWVADPALASRWQPEVRSYEITEQPAGMVGTEFVETIARKGRSAELHGFVSAYRPGEMVAFELRGPGVAIHARYDVEATPEGATVHAAVQVDPERPVPRPLRWLVRRRMERQLRSELHELRRQCEAAPPDTKEGADGEPGDPLGDRRP